MEIDKATELAEGLMRAHGLTGWTLVFDRARTRAGICRFDRRQIGLSRVLTALYPEHLVRGTVLHEIAHALAGPRHGHDAVWRATARSIGGDGERCLRADAPQPAAPWIGTCARGHEVRRHRRPTRPSSCSQCSPSFAPAHLLAWQFKGRRVYVEAGTLAELAAVGAPTGLPTALLGSGARVILGGSGRFAGLSGHIVKRGRSRYHVKTRIGTVTAPFALVRLARD